MSAERSQGSPEARDAPLSGTAQRAASAS